MARFKQVNDLLDPSENLTSCDYYDVNDISKLKINENDLSVIHLNISSLPLHINELKLFLSLFKVKFDIISISESRVTKSNTLTTNIDIPGYNIEHTPTESKAGGCLLYISNKIPCKLPNDLNVYCPTQLESVFIEVFLSNKPSQIIGTIYKHPSMNVSTFTNNHLKNMLNAIHHENKSTLLTGDFNVNLITYNKRGTYNFLELLCNHNFTPQITVPTRLTEKSATIIDNIFGNNPSFKYLSGNITTSTSDHLPQFIILENFKGSNLKREQISTTYRDFRYFNINSLKRDLQEINWNMPTWVLKLFSNFSMKPLINMHQLRNQQRKKKILSLSPGLQKALKNLLVSGTKFTKK